jgi:hypothetical protein
MDLERGWLTVRERLALPEPDTSWMSDPVTRRSSTSSMGKIGGRDSEMPLVHAAPRVCRSAKPPAPMLAAGKGQGFAPGRSLRRSMKAG